MSKEIGNTKMKKKLKNKRKKSKKDLVLLGIQRNMQVEAGFFDGRFVVRIEKTKKEKNKNKKMNKKTIIKELE